MFVFYYHYHMSDKIKILFCPSDRQGVGHFRTIWPAQQIARKHSGEFEVTIEYEIDTNNIEYLSKFDIIHFHRSFGPYEKSGELFAELKKRGVTLIMDIDDYWTPPSNHHIYQAVKAERLDEKIVENMKHVEMVTTTTELFAKEIEQYNKNVHVMPNALKTEDQMWKSGPVENKTGKVRISWIGGSSHKYDLMKVQPSMSMLNSDVSLKDKYQFILCGFDVRGTMTEIKPDGEKFVRPINKEESVWLDFEKIFTSNYSLIKSDQEYVKWLNKIKNEEYDGEYDKNYVRRWTLPLTQYGKHYDYCDVCIAPLAKTYQHRTPKGQVIMKENTFNKVKSELKIIESGVKKKVLVAQNYGVYSKLIKHGENGILIDDDNKGWYKELKKLINEPEYRDMLANNLHEFVMSNYTMDKIAVDRVAFYKDLVKKKREVGQMVL